MARRIAWIILACGFAAMMAACSSSSGPADTKPKSDGPNLVVQNLTAPATAGHETDIAGNVSFDVKNIGDKDASGVTVRVSIAMDDAGTDDVVCTDITGLAIAAGATQTLSPQSLPVSFDVPIGAMKLRVVVDPENAVAESNDSDNLVSVALSVTPKPGYLYRWAGTVNAAGAGMAAKGAEGQLPHNTSLYWPVDVSFDHLNRIYVLDWNNHRVMNLDENGKFNLLIGGYFGDAADGIANKIGLNHPTHVVEAPDGSILLLAWHNSLIKRLDVNTGYISTICGIYDDVNNRKWNADEIPASQAYLDLPVTGVFDAAGNFYFGDQGSMIVREIDTSGIIHTIAGQHPDSTGTPKHYQRYPGYAGDGGPAVDSKLSFEFSQSANPSGRICMDSQENIYIADTNNHCVRRILKANAYIETFAGKGPGFAGYSGDGGPATEAKLQYPRDVACDSQDNLYIADTANHCIRMVDTNGIIHTVAGVGGSFGDPGTPRAVPALEARFRGPYGVEVDMNDNLWISDRGNNLIRVLYK